ncbi:hypothetical protein [Agromyces mangrovi Wang et al. 2018]|uniref:hypothetical protein n=1 Tax=Agromyces mangrovi TaxID=1858653 RepID=UPI002572E9FC|nr:hypothetical protein [Agromyces mangrovi]BDZ63703.1 hypothetical protein GCM10025877_06410 [Agromyces mangrovi]
MSIRSAAAPAPSVPTGPVPLAHGGRRTTARVASWAAVAAYLAQFGVGAAAFAAGVDTGDHSQGLGVASEALGGFAFLAAAVALAALAPRGVRLAAWIPAIVGLGASGATMIWVVWSRFEPPFELFLAEVALSALGLIAVGVLGAIRRSVWPWWVGVAVALIIPIMFLVPVNSLPLAAVWVAVALTARPATRS